MHVHEIQVPGVINGAEPYDSAFGFFHQEVLIFDLLTPGFFVSCIGPYPDLILGVVGRIDPLNGVGKEVQDLFQIVLRCPSDRHLSGVHQLFIVLNGLDDDAFCSLCVLKILHFHGFIFELFVVLKEVLHFLDKVPSQF